MPTAAYVTEMSSRVEQLHHLAKELYDGSEDFPALNRNLKRILASIEMLKLNLEKAGETGE